MNTVSIMHLLKRVVFAVVLVLPAVSWADDHLLDINGATVTQQAIVPHTGALSRTLILAAGFNGEAAPLEFGSGQSLTVHTIALVKMCAPGTGGNLEWLDQGPTVVGVTGTLTSTTPATYTLTLGMGPVTDSYSTSNGTCSTAGAKTYTYTSSAVITQGITTPLTNTYNFWNVAGTVPIPGTIFLLLIGMLVLGWMSMKRQMQDKMSGEKV